MINSLLFVQLALKDGILPKTHWLNGNQLRVEAENSKTPNFKDGVLCILNLLCLVIQVELFRDGKKESQDGQDPLKLTNKNVRTKE